MNTINNRIRIINHKNANKNIINKAKNFITRTFLFMEQPNHNIRVFYYIDKDNNIIGYIILKKIKVVSPRSLVSIIDRKDVYDLSIKIDHKHQRKGYATDFFGQILHKIINEEDAFIYLTDSTVSGIGKKLYGGPKVVEKFDVYHKFDGGNGYYLIGKKTDKEKRVHYLKLNNNDENSVFYFARANETNIGRMHRNGYLKNNPSNS